MPALMAAFFTRKLPVVETEYPAVTDAANIHAFKLKPEKFQRLPRQKCASDVERLPFASTSCNNQAYKCAAVSRGWRKGSVQFVMGHTTWGGRLDTFQDQDLHKRLVSWSGSGSPWVTTL